MTTRPVSLQRLARSALLTMLLASLVACASEETDILLGETEFATVDVPAEASEQIVELAVKEGQRVEAGDLIARLDDARLRLQLDAARATAAQAESALLEATHGARIETIDAARAALRRNEALWAESRTEMQRAEQLRKQGLVAQQALDSAQANERRTHAERDAARADLNALLAGTRAEQIAQAQAAVRVAQARVAEIELVQTRYALRAPRAGTIDALPFELGDRPPLGASTARIAVGAQPYVRVFVPASRRAAVHVGDRFDIRLTGVRETLQGRLREVAKEPAFTPYYALVGDDASKLVFRAEIDIENAPDAALPAGLPATVHIGD
ncbi:MAG: HlyD family efflux transporter periplasmic adaptor subunit [Xanthomonadales bacterium]|nr:HlyD family efflux transporter periplasmic adaptor subunit [Xanthomonadales bacterium]